jgi:hypothetical protein
MLLHLENTRLLWCVGLWAGGVYIYDRVSRSDAQEAWEKKNRNHGSCLYLLYQILCCVLVSKQEV